MVALAALLVAGCGGEGGSEAAAATGGRGGDMEGGMGGPSEVAVEVAMVERIALTRSVGVSGVVAPLRMVGVNSRVAGSVLELHVEEGDAVREGDLLALLDGRELEAALAAAEASYQVAEAALERAERLRERQVITVPEYEAERTAHAAARAQLDQLQTRLGYTRVTAPAAGVVVEKSIEAGDVVNTNARLFSLAEVSTLVVRVGVSELDVVQISVGDEAEVRLDALPQGAFTGRVRRIFPSADPETRLVPVEVALESAAGQIARPGFLARVNFALDARVDALVVPQSALLAGAASDAVFVVEDGRALRRSVERGLTSQGRVEILDGLREGETVVTVGHNNLRDGAEVRVVARDGQTSTASGDDDASRPATDDQP